VRKLHKKFTKFKQSSNKKTKEEKRNKSIKEARLHKASHDPLERMRGVAVHHPST
jgi:hypothetical protein